MSFDIRATHFENHVPDLRLIQHSLCVFCGASEDIAPHYRDLAKSLGRAIQALNYRLVYGGGGVGLMGDIARTTQESGGDVLGIMPKFLMELEGILDTVNHILVDDMHTRKRLMYDASAAFIVLPGGIGTLEECIEVMSWMRMDLHSKPIIFLSENGYWDPLVTLIDHIIEQGFCPASMRDQIFLTQTIDGAMDILRAQEIVGKPE